VATSRLGLLNSRRAFGITVQKAQRGVGFERRIRDRSAAAFVECKFVTLFVRALSRGRHRDATCVRALRSAVGGVRVIGFARCVA